MRTGNIFDAVEQRFDQLRRELLGDAWEPGGRGVAGVRTPVTDVVEEDDAYVATVELPGFDKQDVKVDVDENGLRIHARKEAGREEEGRRYLRRERTSQAFERHVSFPEQVSPEGAKATFRNGVLEVRVPKTSPEKRRARSIEID